MLSIRNLADKVRNSDMELGRSKRWQITDNDADDLDQLETYILQLGKFYQYVYCIWFLENAPSTNHRHAHVFIKFVKQVYGSIKRIIPGCHLETCRGTDIQNINYIKKNGNFKELGEAPQAVMKQKEKDEFYLQLIKDCKELPEDVFLNRFPSIYFNHYQKVLDARTRSNSDKTVFNGELKEKIIGFSDLLDLEKLVGSINNSLLKKFMKKMLINGGMELIHLSTIVFLLMNSPQIVSSWDSLLKSGGIIIPSMAK